MKRQKFSIARVFIGLIIAIMLIIAFGYFYVKITDRNRPFDWEYKKPILQQIENADISITYDQIRAIGGGYEIDLIAKFVSAGSLKDAVKVFNAVTDYADAHEDHPMHGNDLIIVVMGSGGAIKIEYWGGKTSVLISSTEMGADSYGVLGELNYGVDNLTVNGCNFGVDALLELSDLKRLECNNCFYRGKSGTSPNNADIQKMKEKFPDCVIKVNGETIE